MRLESDAEVVVGFVALVVFAILMITAGKALYSNGYYEGKAECVARQNDVLQKALIKEEAAK